ncbi:MAG: hypothetical protein V3W18_04190 [candidate division Zixibacteria bacterium]
MSFLVAIDPDIMDDEQFVNLWNTDDECAQAATAETKKIHTKSFGLEGQVGVYLIGVASSLTATMIIAMIKKLFGKKRLKASVEIIESRTPDGRRTLIIKKLGDD